MKENTIITAKIQSEMAELIDKYANDLNISRSAAIRILISSGLINDETTKRLDKIELKIDRIAFILEMVYQLSFVNAGIAADTKPDKVNLYKTEANKRLVKSLIDKFGE